MILILLGAPGTGKGTQAKVLAQRRGWLHLSTGDMLRENVQRETELGKKAKSYMDEGRLVPDQLIIDMLLERISQPDVGDGLVLDGFPRTLPQAEALDRALEASGKSVDSVVMLAVPDEELVRRLSTRWLCRNCGYIANTRLDKCPSCGGSDFYQRQDDQPDKVRVRLETQKPPADMVDFYRRAGKLFEIDGTQSVEQVTSAILNHLGDANS
jgi:adenylate kinase